MFHQQLIGLIIGISFCSIQCTKNPSEFYKNQRFTMCGWENQATCKVKEPNGKWTCKPQWICAEQWMVRNDEGICIPVWDCPDICPPNAEFLSCRDDVRPFSTLKANKFIDLCQPHCPCKKGYITDPDNGGCIDMFVALSLRFVEDVPNKLHNTFMSMRG